MQKRGGRRQGAGRPFGAKSKATIQALEVRRRMEKEVELQNKPLLDALFRLALGRYKTNSGRRIYIENPNIAAIAHLFNQTIGKPQKNLGSTVNEGPKLKTDISGATNEDLNEQIKELFTKN